MYISGLQTLQRIELDMSQTEDIFSKTVKDCPQAYVTPILIMGFVVGLFSIRNEAKL